jgi:Pyruvate/2-oxoacid:ferredoxin oxidoreductase gamma subunit
VPFTAIAIDLGQPIVKNVVALGALHASTQLLPAETLLAALRQMLHGKGAAVALNEEAFRRGGDAASRAQAA